MQLEVYRTEKFGCPLSSVKPHCSQEVSAGVLSHRLDSALQCRCNDCAAKLFESVSHWPGLDTSSYSHRQIKRMRKRYEKDTSPEGVLSDRVKQGLDAVGAKIPDQLVLSFRQKGVQMDSKDLLWALKHGRDQTLRRLIDINLEQGTLQAIQFLCIFLQDVIKSGNKRIYAYIINGVSKRIANEITRVEPPGKGELQMGSIEALSWTLRHARWTSSPWDFLKKRIDAKLAEPGLQGIHDLGIFYEEANKKGYDDVCTYIKAGVTDRLKNEKKPVEFPIHKDLRNSVHLLRGLLYYAIVCCNYEQCRKIFTLVNSRTVQNSILSACGDKTNHFFDKLTAYRPSQVDYLRFINGIIDPKAWENDFERLGTCLNSASECGADPVRSWPTYHLYSSTLMDYWNEGQWDQFAGAMDIILQGKGSIFDGFDVLNSFLDATRLDCGKKIYNLIFSHVLEKIRDIKKGRELRNEELFVLRCLLSYAVQRGRIDQYKAVLSLADPYSIITSRNLAMSSGLPTFTEISVMEFIYRLLIKKEGS